MNKILLYAVPLIIIFFSLFTNSFLSAQASAPFPIPDKPIGLINDYPRALTIEQNINLTKKMQRLLEKNGTQIVLVITPSTGEETTRDYAVHIQRKWISFLHHGEGNYILFVMDAAKADFYILTGPKITGDIPDVKLSRIVRDKILPYWGKRQFYEGIDAAVTEFISLIETLKTRNQAFKVTNVNFNYRTVGIVLLAGVGFYYILFVTLNIIKRRSLEVKL
jgi:uncharacterized membrane protein YgcG